METNNQQPNYSGLQGGATKRQTYKKTKVNQIILVQYEIANAKTGHVSSVVDSYRNVLARIHAKPEDGKGIMYSAIDTDGILLFKGSSLEAVRQEFIKHRELYLQRAYEKRLEKIKQAVEARKLQEQQSKQAMTPDEEKGTKKTATRAAELKVTRAAKSTGRDRSQGLSQ